MKYSNKSLQQLQHKLQSKLEKVAQRINKLSPKTLSVIIFFALVVIVTINLLLLYEREPYNSDDAALFVMTNYFSFDKLPSWMPPDTFFLKLPFNLIAEGIFGHSSAALFVSAWSALVSGIALFVYVIYKIVVRAKASQHNLYTMLAVIAFTFPPSVTYMFALRSPHIRTIEIGLIVLAVYLIASHVVSHAAMSKRVLVSLGLFLGIQFLNDPGTIFFIGVPVGLLFGLKLVRGENISRVLEAVYALLIGGIIYKIGHSVLMSLDFRMYEAPAHFVKLENLIDSITRVTEGIFSMFNASFWGLSVSSPEALFALVYVGILIYGAVAIFVGIKKGNDSEKLLGFAAVSPILLLILSDKMADLTSIRYLITVPFFTALMVVIAIHKGYFPPLFKRLLPVILTLFVFLNIVIPAVGLAGEYLDTKTNSKNELNYQISGYLNTLPPQKGYGAYWIANITNHYGAFSKPIIPIVCDSKGARLFRWVMFDGYAQETATRSYIIANGTNLTPDFSPKNSAALCTYEDVIKTFGEPVSQAAFKDNTKILFYNYDIGTKLYRYNNKTAP